MRFAAHGNVTPETIAALKAAGHHVHALSELTSDEISDPAALAPVDLLAALVRKQWQLITTDGALVHTIFENKLEFPRGLIVHIQTEDPADHPAAIARLFERYSRLTPKRMYILTASRVKIRQLPGLD
jgi:hypothetical protein